MCPIKYVSVSTIVKYSTVSYYKSNIEISLNQQDDPAVPSWLYLVDLYEVRKNLQVTSEQDNYFSVQIINNELNQ